MNEWINWQQKKLMNECNIELMNEYINKCFCKFKKRVIDDC